MMTVIVIVSIVLLLAVPIVVENRDVLMGRFATGRHRVADDVGLPFLILPLAPVDHDGGASIAPERIHPPRTIAASSRPVLQRSAAPALDVDDVPSPATGPADDVPTDATVIFRRTGDEAMQLLPGRLRVLAGEPARADIRLFGLIGEPARVTIGRDGGPPHHVVTLHSPTVSRRHARLDFTEGAWVIRNLSRTNPVVVNDATLADTRTTRTLADGDRIELGEVVLQFMER